MAKLNVKAGDKIRVVNANSPMGVYKNGDIFTVKEAIEVIPELSWVKVEEHGTIIFPEEFELAEQVIEPGTKIRITNASAAIGYGNGDILTVKSYHPKKFGLAEHVRTEEAPIAILRKEFEVIEQPAQPAFKVGDTVKLNVEGHPKHGWGAAENGDIGEIIEVRTDELIVKFPTQNRWYADPSELELVVEEEPAPKRSEHVTEKRHAKVGERILIVNANPINDQDFENGDVFTVTGLCDVFEGDVEVSGQPDMIDKREYEVIIEPAPAASEEPAKIEEGDLVHVEGHTAYFGVIEDGLDEDGEYYIIDGDGDGEYVDDKLVTLVAKATDRKDK